MTGAGGIPSDMQAELDRFDREAEAIIAAFVGPMDSMAPPAVIYHYTNDVGLKGILESGTAWLTDIFDLSDPSEVRHGFSHAVDILNARAAGSLPESELFARQFETIDQRGGIRAAAHYFVCSFSATGDDLGQWRAYADNGRGYALGFDAKVIEDGYTKSVGAPISNNSTFHVTYDDKQLAELQRRIIDVAFSLISLPRGRNLERDAINEYMKTLSILVSMHCLRASLFFKHEAYRNEQEYRFMQLYRADRAAPDVKLRARGHSLVKYSEFNWRRVAPRALRQIVVGPAADFQRAEQFARECLATVPFRHRGNHPFGYSISCGLADMARGATSNRPSFTAGTWYIEREIPCQSLGR